MAPSGGPARRQPRDGRSGARGPELCNLCRVREHCNMAYKRLTHIQRLLGSKPTPLQSSTTQASNRPLQERACMPQKRKLATATKICTKGYFPPGHPGASTANPCVSPTHSCTYLAATATARCNSNNASGLSIIHFHFFRRCPLRQVGCYTILSGFQPSWPPPCYL